MDISSISIQNRKRTHKRSAKGQATLGVEWSNGQEDYLEKRMRGLLGHHDVTKELCRGGLGLKIKTKMRAVETDAFLLVAANEVSEVEDQLGLALRS